MIITLNYICWVTNVRDGLDPINQVNTATCCACPKPGPELQSTNILVCVCVCEREREREFSMILS